MRNSLMGYFLKENSKIIFLSIQIKHFFKYIRIGIKIFLNNDHILFLRVIACI